MALTGLHDLTPSTVATSTTSYEYFRDELLKQNENAPLWKSKTAPLGVVPDDSNDELLIIGYGYRNLGVRPYILH